MFDETVPIGESCTALRTAVRLLSLQKVCNFEKSGKRREREKYKEMEKKKEILMKMIIEKSAKKQKRERKRDNERYKRI